MRIYFDTEFLVHNTEPLPELLTIGLVREDGATYYAENGDARIREANDWVQMNVLPHMTGPVKTKIQIAREVREFLGGAPELWAYYGTQDHMLLLDLLGGWMLTPEPARVFHDIETLLLITGTTAEQMPKVDGPQHNALIDALWVREAYIYAVKQTHYTNEEF